MKNKKKSKLLIRPTSIEWLPEDSYCVATYFSGLGFTALQEILDLRVFDLLNMRGINAIRAEEIITCLYLFLNPNDVVDEAMYNGTLLQPFSYPLWSELNLPVTPDMVSYGSNKLFWWKGKCRHEWQASPHRRTGKKKVGCPYCSGNKVMPGVNDLASRFPEIATEWSDRNLPLTPDRVTPFSNQKVWWQDKCGHEWFALISSRTEGHGCPYCKDHKLLAGFNDLQTLHPAIAREWSERNFPLRPDMIPETKAGMFWWKCSDCGGEYEAWIQSRIDGSKCPYCAGRKVQPGINDLSTTDPRIAAEWCYELNKDITPDRVHRSSKQYFWWHCPRGHKWKAKVAERTIEQRYCTKCGQEFLKFLPKLLFIYYLQPRKISVMRNTSEFFGLALDIFIPELKLAIDNKRNVETNEQKIKRYILMVKGCDYCLFPKYEQAADIVYHVRSILKKYHLYVNTTPEYDIEICRKKFELFLNQS
ncbi:MAG: hypothetical protein EGP80_00215 [Blautia wexlerae]|nr:hypothetical protein [Blautia wexlerae]